MNAKTKAIAKSITIPEICAYLGIDIKGKMLRNNTSIRLFDNGTRFHDFSCQEAYGHGDVIAFYDYITNYQGNGISSVCGFAQACEEVAKIALELHPELATKDIVVEQQNTGGRRLPPIPPQTLNKEMVLVLQEKLFGFDKADPKYKEILETPNEEFEKAETTKREVLLKNVRNRFYSNITCGVIGHDDYKSDTYIFKKSNFAMGYLQSRGISKYTIEKFMRDGYLVQTTGHWTQKQADAVTILKDGVSQTTYKGKPWHPVEDGYIHETYNFYNTHSQATWLSYDEEGRLNSMWSRGFYSGTDTIRKPQYSYMPQHRDQYSYNEHVFLYDPECPLAEQNKFMQDLYFQYTQDTFSPLSVEEKKPDTDKTVIVFESTIDLMSFYELCRKTNQDPDYFTYCSLNGAGKVLQGLQELKDRGYSNIALCLDNDRTGQLDSLKGQDYGALIGLSVTDITSQLDFPMNSHTYTPVKDCNEALCEMTEGNYNFVDLTELGYAVPDMEEEVFLEEY